MKRLLLTLGVLFATQASAATFINVTAAPYNAACTGVAGTDDNTAIQAAVAAAHASTNGAALYIPAGAVCRYSSSIVLTKMISIIGDGPAVSQLVYTGAGDAVRINAQAGDNEGHVIRDIFIRPGADAGGGQYGIQVQLATGATYSYFKYDNVRIGNFNARGIWFNNIVSNQDGFFNGTVNRSIVANGLLGTKIGDSIAFRDVVFTGKNNVDLTGLPNGVSARLVSIEGGQISTANGFLRLTGMDGFRMRNVWMERAAPVTGLTYDSAIYIEDSADTMFEGNTFAVPSPSIIVSVFSIVGSRDTKIINNAFSNRGSAAHIYGTSTTQRTRVEGNLYFSDQRGTTLATPVVVLQGS